MGTVFGVHFPDELATPAHPGSQSGAYMEYDIALWRPRTRIYRVPMIASRNGKADGDVIVLRAAKLPLNENDYTTDTQGDVVIVGFLEGDGRRPVILGCYPHPKGTIVTSSNDGEVRRIKHKGATLELKSDGAVEITSAGGAFAKLLADGTVEVKPASGKLLLLHGASQFLALASKLTTRINTLITQVNALVTAYNAHTHAFTATAGTDPLTTAVSGALGTPATTVTQSELESTDIKVS